MICSKCGAELQDGAQFCNKCGQRIEFMPQQQQQPQQQTQYTPAQNPWGGNVPNQPMRSEEEPGKGLATASLILGILSLVFIFVGTYALIGTLLGSIGIILAAVAKKKGNKSGVGTAGLVMSIIGVSLTLISFLACVACIADISNSL